MKKILSLILALSALFCFIPVFAQDSIPASGTAVEQSDVQNGAAVRAADQPAEHSGESNLHLDGSSLSLLWIIPFAGILLSIALCPLLCPEFWHHHFGKVSLGWWLIFFAAFLISKGPAMSFYYLIETYILEFFPFIILLLALFTVAGGIRLKGELAGTPAVNAVLILIGAALASWMGTTGAAMLMIRPLINANKWRKYRTHVVIFFIFMVANIGGSLTPLGDPPLFMGFLKGVSFFWTAQHLLIPMGVTLGILTVVFLIIDTYFYRKEPGKPEKNPGGEKLSLEGKRNILLLPLIPAAVLISSMDLGTAFTIHHVSVPAASLLQMALLLLITAVSIKITPKPVREKNEFTWDPILEVAKLFATIFMTMIPAIAMLRAGADGPLGAVISSLSLPTGEFINSNFFWATGALSSFLDNAPTYMIFFNTAGGNAADLMTSNSATLMAISMGAVFMGANTYIGNAPNFMVKAIAEERGVPMPSFFGYILKYSLPILIPTFIIVTFIFF